MSDKPAMTMREIREALGHKIRDEKPALHLVIEHPEPGEWLGRLDVVEALEAADWAADDDMPLSILRHPSGAVFAVTDEAGACGLDCPNGAVIEFPGATPTVVVVAACLAATHPAP